MEPFAFVRLSRGLFALVSSEDLEAVSVLRWHIQFKPRGTAYASATYREDGQRKHIKLHRFVWNRMGGAPTPIVDHENGWGLDCRRGNLRAATPLQNARNASRAKNNSSGFKGVDWDRRRKKWRARISTDVGRRTLGHFADPVEASIAYQEAVADAHGDFGKKAAA